MQPDQLTYTNRAGIAFKRFWDTVAAGSAVLLFMIATSGTIDRVLMRDAAPKVVPVVHLEVVTLEFLNGLFHQLVVPMSGDVRQARWTASIWLDGKFVCGGSGTGTYIKRTEPVKFTPNDWTDDDCSRMEPGAEYVAVAAWEYAGNHGQIHTINDQLTFRYERQLYVQ